MERIAEQPLFGGAISCSLPTRFQTVSNIREVPDNQEVFADASRDESVIVELLELKPEIPDEQSASWFLQDLASEQDALMEMESVSQLQPGDVPFLDPSIVKGVAVGKLKVSKSRQSADAANIVRIYMANLRLRSVKTDVLISVYEPLYISALSESAASGGSGFAVPAAVAGCSSALEVFQTILRTLKVHDWALFVN
ncbi:ran guanine nucleotide release factor [Selaginella moellendorffii]|uniref:ran guanine nucleotide release factor n=1 Tax=Selaginella moellendorffii TaxID=88036 RepID=UPI000D1D00B6|nr:ran guanine nucleotide release factor [Selaginella moellendorffii]XP_024522835.1 ran guanine nucleotide release factor [Selaginella moellendorffii]XP_024522836.1 ran guanine nucleotide release factor [Selaginella moellendorffii]|eukprot:XP_024522834.1 ran guanine nucleotide release factor [Selaginella moellendorffii]